MIEVRIKDFTGDIIEKKKDKESIFESIIKKGLKLDTQILKYIDPHDTSTLNRLMIEALVGDIRMMKRTCRDTLDEKQVVILERLEKLCITALSTPFQYMVFEPCG